MDDRKENKKDEYLFGLDIGTSKLNMFVGISEGDSVRVVECSEYPLKDAEELDSIVKELKKAIRELENSTGVDIQDVYVGVAGNYVNSFGYQGLLTLSTGIVRDEDIRNVLKQAGTIPPNAGEILHEFPCGYWLDGEGPTKHPKGKSCTRLEAQVQLVTSRRNALDNLRHCIENAGLKVAKFVLETYASSYSVLTEEEKELGVALIDMGAGSTDIAVFLDDSIRYTASLDLAGTKITEDICKCIQVPIAKSKAEEIKHKYGTCAITNLNENETFPVMPVGGRNEVSVSRKYLANVIIARVQEIFKLIANDLKKRKIDTLINGGIVLVGGCCALEGIEDVATKVFGKPARIGHPKGMSGLQEAYQNPSYATGIGLLYYANNELKHEKRKKKETGAQISLNVKNGVQRFVELIKKYL